MTNLTLDYFRAWNVPVPPECGQDRLSAFHYSGAGLRKLALLGFVELEVEAQDADFEVRPQVLDLHEDLDVLAGFVTFRSHWGTLRIYAIRGMNRQLIHTEILK